MFSTTREAIINQTIKNFVEARALAQEDAEHFSKVLQHFESEELVVILVISHDLREAVSQLNRLVVEFNLN